ncbi:MAG: hypothetical protein LBK91_05765 [Synergistaceae bacterium]|nr:hypothetical protein [Synergistaceae bacterium]
MDTEYEAKTYLIVKGYIDAKDERGSPLFGTLLAVVSRRDLKYLSVMFSRDKSCKSMEWNELLPLHRGRENEPYRDPMLKRHEDELFKYLAHGSILNSIAKNYNAKQTEQAISRYCLDKMQLKAVSLIEFFEASDEAIALFEHSGDAAAGETPKTGEAPLETAETDGAGVPSEDVSESKNKDTLIIRCEPILDPVGGIAMSEINIGEVVMTRLPSDSVFFKLLSKNISGFDGVVTASVTGVLMNELGTATISLALADGITGVMKLSGKVKVKTAAPGREERDENRGGQMEIPAELVFVLAGVTLFLCGVAILYYILM